VTLLDRSADPELGWTAVPFPVITSVPLNPVRFRLFRAAKRSLHELPEQASGSVLVFQSNAKFSLAQPGPKMLASSVVVEATAAVVVSVKQELVPVTAPLPSVDGQGAVYVRASFYCLVTDPVLVLEAGCWSVGPRLRDHLVDDPKLRMLGVRDDVAVNPEVAQRILARTLARNQLEPPSIPGMQVKLVDIALGIQSGWAHASPGGPELPEDRTDDGYDDDGLDGYRRDPGESPLDGYASYPEDVE
jgi:hypothetical protein